jgi:hypothetical protein
MRITASASLALIAALAGTAGSAYATQPPDSVKSDSAANTAMGASALADLTTGTSNTAAGDQALLKNSDGSYETAFGAQALYSNTTGQNNTATGAGALSSNTTGNFNSAFGSLALGNNVTGNDNTAMGLNALIGGPAGNDNTAVGYSALFDTGGQQNTAVGSQALYANFSGSSNTAIGFQAAYNTTGVSNTALGRLALVGNTTGDRNIGVGDHGGQNLTTGSYNIEIGNDGSSSDNGVIRIGTAGSQTATYIAGIDTAKVTGAAVYVTSSGQLGVLASSERYKTAIAPMDSTTEKLKQLRPVTFHLKTDPDGAVQYGLIAEEVDKVYPELVIRDDAGKVQGVRYDELAPMLLNEMQKEAQQLSAQEATVKIQGEALAEIGELKQQVAELTQLNQSMQAALYELQAKNERVAMR